MTDLSSSEIAALLRTHNAALLEMVDIALTAIRESRDTSVSAMHAITRLNRVSESLRTSAGLTRLPPGTMRR